MVDIVAFEGTYPTITGWREEIVIGTRFGTAHITVRRGRKGDTRHSVDFVPDPLTAFVKNQGIREQREQIKRTLYFNRAKRYIAKGGGAFTSSPFPTSEGYLKCRPGLKQAIADNSRVANCWKRLTGEDQSHQALQAQLETAAQFKERQKLEQVEAIKQAALENDPVFGMF